MSQAPAQRTWESLVVGEEATLTRLISMEDITAFVLLSGDANPLHIAEGVAHGMLLGSLVSALVGMQLPGERALLLKESLLFKKPVKAGDTVEVRGTLVHKSESTRVIDLALVIKVGGVEVASGEAQAQVRP